MESLLRRSCGKARRDTIYREFPQGLRLIEIQGRLGRRVCEEKPHQKSSEPKNDATQKRIDLMVEEKYVAFP